MMTRDELVEQIALRERQVVLEWVLRLLAETNATAVYQRVKEAHTAATKRLL